MMNPIVLKTTNAANRLGELVEIWSKSPADAPGTLSGDKRTVSMSRAEFTTAMGLEIADEFEIRDGVDFVELVVRRSNTATLLLPETSVFEHHAKVLADGSAASDRAPTTIIAVPRVYMDLSPDTAKVGVGDIETNLSVPSNYEVEVTGDALDAFLRPFMAGYVCTQCM